MKEAVDEDDWGDGGAIVCCKERSRHRRHHRLPALINARALPLHRPKESDLGPSHDILS